MVVDSLVVVLENSLVLLDNLVVASEELVVELVVASSYQNCYRKLFGLSLTII